MKTNVVYLGPLTHSWSASTILKSHVPCRKWTLRVYSLDIIHVFSIIFGNDRHSKPFHYQLIMPKFHVLNDFIEYCFHVRYKHDFSGSVTWCCIMSLSIFPQDDNKFDHEKRRNVTSGGKAASETSNSHHTSIDRHIVLTHLRESFISAVLTAPETQGIQRRRITVSEVCRR